MSSHFFSPKIQRTLVQLSDIKTFYPYAEFKSLALSKGAHFPYPICGMGAYRANNKLHEAILKNELDSLRQQALKHPDNLKGLSWGNTPLLLSLKRGNTEATRVVIDVMIETLSEEDCHQIFAERDSMGLMALSYALFLRVPYDVMQACLVLTPKRTYYIDPVYPLFVEALKLDDLSCPYKVTERGYEFRNSQGGFAIYELSPMELLAANMPTHISIKGDIRPEVDFGIVQQGGEPSIRFNQILRNLLFHTRALCENRGLSLSVPAEEILSSPEELAYDVSNNYPRLATARNNSLDVRIKSLVASWDKVVFDEEWDCPDAVSELKI